MTARGPLLTRRSLLGASLAGLLLPTGCAETKESPAPGLQRRLEAGGDLRPREIGVLGDSIAFGGGAFGSTPPKYLSSFVGQLRSAIRPTHGDAGTGWVFLNQALWPTTPTNDGWDPRLRVVGAVSKPSSGLFRRTCARIPPSRGRHPSSYVEFRAVGTSFSTLVLGQVAGGGRQLVSIDGGPPLALRNVWRGGPEPDVEAEEGTHANHVVTEFPASGPGSHTVRVWADKGAVDLVALRASTGAGEVVVTSAAVSGESLMTFCGPGADDETGGSTGLPFLDTLRFDVLVLELGANDYNSGSPLATTQGYLEQVIHRQRATGGDVALLFPPISSPRLYPGGGAPTYEEYAAMFADVAAREDCLYLDLTRLWGRTFEESEALRPPRYADGIHPSDLGATDIARRCQEALAL